MAPSILRVAALALAACGLACGSSSSGGGGPSSASGSGSGSRSRASSGTGSDRGSSSGSGSSLSGGSAAGTCSPSLTFQCPPPSADCPGADAGGSAPQTCGFGQICVTTDGCLSEDVSGSGCVDVDAEKACASSCAAVEATLTNMGCPPSWSLNTMTSVGTPATGCTAACN